MIKIFPNDVDGRAAAESEPAVDGKKEVVFAANGRRILVHLGSDVPDPLPAESAELNAYQLFQGLFLVGGQPLYNAAFAWVEDRKTTGTPTQKIYWRHGVLFRRVDPEINRLRLAVQGARSNAVSLAEMDQAFTTGRVL